jgi:hypothetical protein
MPKHSRLAAVALLATTSLLLAPLPGCDREEDPPPPIVVVTPEPVEPVRGVIAETSFSGFQTGIWVGIEVLVSTRGKLDITVDWTSNDTWMFVYLGEHQCGFVELSAGTCPFLISSETKLPKPRVLFTEILDPATYYLYLYNVPRIPGTEIGSDVSESVALQLGLTVGFEPREEGEEPVRLGRPRVLAPPQL